MRRTVTAHVEGSLEPDSEIVLSVAVADGVPLTGESLAVTLDGAPAAVTEMVDATGGRWHRISGGGALVVDYAAETDALAAAPPAGAFDRIEYLRPSRYCDSDRLLAVATSEFGSAAGKDLLDAVSSWVGRQLAYVSGSSRPVDGAVDTFLRRQGVCRDFAHLVIALLRGLGVPARMVSVYAPGLSPMDFHAVAEAWVDDGWWVVDATTLAPRPSLLRIATGRDAADTAFTSVLRGSMVPGPVVVTATVDQLPADDLTLLTALR
ncbi:MAG: transglutaminase-like domain-containing protein [Acidimicrobiales bacterium]